MKHLHTLLLAAGLASLGVSAQNVTVVMKDGSTHKFNADYVSEICIKESMMGQGTQFETLQVDPYSNGDVQLTFTDSKTNTECALWAHSRTDAAWLLPGDYAVNGSDENFKVTSAYSSLSIGGVAETITGGSLEIALDGKTYSFEAVLELESGETFLGYYSGEISGYTQWLDLTMAAAKYNENERQPGNFYIQLNDADWNCEMALDIQAIPTATRLPAGEYSYSDNGGVNTFGPKSYVDIYSPYSSNRLMPGSSLKVSESADAYSISMSLIFENGRTANISYDGPISGTPTFVQPNEPIVFDQFSFFDYSGGNVMYKFTDSASKTTLHLDTYADTNTSGFVPGTYTIAESFEPGFVNTFYSRLYLDGSQENTQITGGTFTIEQTGNLYSFTFDVAYDGGAFPLRGSCSYEAPVMEADAVMATCKYNDSKERPLGNVYISFNDADWNYEIALDVFVNSSATELLPGEYSYSADGGDFTFGPSSYLDHYYPYYSKRFADGSKMSVSRDGDSYSIDMNFVYDDASTNHFIFNGPITGTPKFQLPANNGLK